MRGGRAGRPLTRWYQRCSQASTETTPGPAIASHKNNARYSNSSKPSSVSSESTSAHFAARIATIMFVDGIINAANAFSGRKEHDDWWVLLLVGLAGIGIGLLTFYNPAATALAVVLYVAIWAVATGLLEIVAAVRLRKQIEGEFWLALAGIASVAFGVLLAARPGVGALTILWLIGVYAIAFGVILLLLAFKVRSSVKHVARAVGA